jgi:heptosyltransferase I
MKKRPREQDDARGEPLRRRDFQRILLIKLSAVGDVVHTLPVFAKIRARYPAAQIDWLITPQCADLVRWHPGLSNLLLYPRREFLRSWAGTMAMARVLSQVRRTRYDLVIDMHGQLRTAVFVLGSGAPVRIGFAVTREGARLSYTHHIPVPSMDYHAADRNLWLGGLLGFDAGAPDFTIHLAPEAAVEADAVLGRLGLAERPFAFIFPGTVWQTKHWSAEGFAAVCRYLRGRGLAIVLGGSRRDQARSTAVARLFPEAIDVCGQTSLAVLCAMIQRAAICVTNDSGPMHLAAASGIPLVSAFGPTSPIRTGPHGRPNAVVRVDVACSPCYIRKLRDCPYDHRCMTALSPSMMIERTESVLAEAALPVTSAVG